MTDRLREAAERALTWLSRLSGAGANMSEVDAKDLYATISELRIALDEARRPLHIVFDGPPSHKSGRFVEVEDEHGRSINAGEWRERFDGLWELIIP